MVKFSPEITESLEYIKGEKDALKALSMLLETFVDNQDKDVLRLSLTPDNWKDLAIKKAKAEGARKILLDFRQHFGLNKQ